MSTMPGITRLLTASSRWSPDRRRPDGRLGRRPPPLSRFCGRISGTPTLCALAACTATAAVVIAGCSGPPAARAVPAGPLRLLVSKPVSLYDVPLDIKVAGLAPVERVTLRLTAPGQSWSSSATFVARAPVVDLSRQAPVAGSYRGAHGMGLFESLAPRGSATFLRLRPTMSFTLAASARGHTVSETLLRLIRGPGVRCTGLTVARDGFFGEYCAPPPHAGRRPPVLVFGGSEGGLATVPEAQLLASRGYPALALAYFDEPGLPNALDRIPLEYFLRAIHWLDRRPGASPARLTVYGDSRGSEAALLLGAYFPDLVHAVIAGSPSSVTNGAVSLTHQVSGTNPAWTLNGKPLSVAEPLRDPASSLAPAAVIPVQRIRGPVLLLVGADDALWPSPGYAAAIMSRLHRYHSTYADTDAVFPGAGHAVGGGFPYDAEATTFTTPVGVLNLGGNRFDNSAASARAWQDILTFLHRLG